MAEPDTGLATGERTVRMPVKALKVQVREELMPATFVQVGVEVVICC
jgi:hypothetical protein